MDPPQLTQLVDTAPDGDQWLHEIKYDGYRMHARLDRGAVKLLTRTGLDWTHKYPAIAKAVASLGARQAYLDGELCGVGPDGTTSFNIVQLASDSGKAAALVFFLFDLLYLDGEDLRPRPLIERKQRLSALLANAGPCLHYSDHVVGQGPAFYEKAGAMHVEGNRLETHRCALHPRQPRPMAQGQMPQPRGICRGRLDRSGRKPPLSQLAAPRLSRSYGKLIYAGRVGRGIDTAELERLSRRLPPLATDRILAGHVQLDHHPEDTFDRFATQR
jgi:ATP-dependent DNA ligase